jgi:hypothetical protein
MDDVVVRVSRKGTRATLYILDRRSGVLDFRLALRAPGPIDARRWNYPDGSGIWLSLEYYSGSTNRILLCGPDRRGGWRLLLDTDSEFAAVQPPEVVDRRGNGVADFITIKNVALLREPRRFDANHTICSVWRWDDARELYTKLRDCRYRDRLMVKGSP